MLPIVVSDKARAFDVTADVQTQRRSSVAPDLIKVLIAGVRLCGSSHPVHLQRALPVALNDTFLPLSWSGIRSVQMIHWTMIRTNNE